MSMSKRQSKATIEIIKSFEHHSIEFPSIGFLKIELRSIDRVATKLNAQLPFGTTGDIMVAGYGGTERNDARARGHGAWSGRHCSALAQLRGRWQNRGITDQEPCCDRRTRPALRVRQRLVEKLSSGDQEQYSPRLKRYRLA